MHSVREGWRYNGDFRRRLSCRNSRAAGGGEDNARIEADHLVRKPRQSVHVPVRKPIRDVELLSIDISEVSHALQESFDENPRSGSLAP
jgi:hypothetical protein